MTQDEQIRAAALSRATAEFMAAAADHRITAATVETLWEAGRRFGQAECAGKKNGKAKGDKKP